MDAKGRLEQVLADHDVAITYPEEVLAETQAWLDEPGIDDDELVDLTDLAFATIDNADSRDLDQAVFVRPEADRTILYYALADAAYYVRVGTHLFAEALRRGASYYLPGLSVPMLPPALSEGLISLNPEVPRRSVVVIMALDGRGVCTHARATRARIVSRAKLSYDGVDAWLHHGAQAPTQDDEVQASLRAMAHVGRLRIAEARRRNVVRFARREISVEIGESGVAFTAEGDCRNDVERYNEQISLLCNVQVAAMLAEARGDDVQPIFRVHPAPSEEAVESLRKKIAALVRVQQVDGLHASAWLWRDDEVLADYLARTARLGNERVYRAITYHALRSNSASSFSSELGPHFGVGAAGYARASAPMREIVGVFTHKELAEACLGEPSPPGEQDERLREEVITAGNHARQLQRRLTKSANKLVLDDVLGGVQDRDGTLRGTIVQVASSRLYVELDEPPIAVKVYREHLEEQLGRKLGVLERDVAVGDEEVRFVLGSAIVLSVAGCDDRGRWRLEVR